MDVVILVLLINNLANLFSVVFPVQFPESVAHPAHEVYQPHTNKHNYRHESVAQEIRRTNKH